MEPTSDAPRDAAATPLDAPAASPEAPPALRPSDVLLDAALADGTASDPTASSLAVPVLERASGVVFEGDVPEGEAPEEDGAPGWQALGVLSPGGLLPDDLSQLRALLVGPEQAEIARLRRRLREVELKGRGLAADQIADALPDAVIENERQGTRLAQALSATMRQSLSVAVREDPEPVAEAIFPIIGPAIRRAVTDAMRSMTSTINQTLERSLSVQSIGWRVEAARTGRPFSEIALSHTLQYRVEQVFLIDRETGLPHLHVVADGVPEPDPSLFAGMLTAIRDFAHDTLGARTDTLGRLQMGEVEVWIEAGASAYVAAVVRGVPPQDLRGQLSEVVETMHLKYAQELAQPPGAVSLDPARPALAQALSQQLRDTRQGLHPVAKAVLVLALLALALWLGATAWRAWAWREAVARLRATPGVVVTRAERHGGRGFVEGLRDPLSPDVRALVAATRWKDRPVDWALQPFASLDAPFVVARASRRLQAPSSVTLALHGDTLVVGGQPSAAFADKARREGPFVEGVGSVRVVRGFAEERARMHRLAEALSTAQLTFAPRLTEPVGLSAVVAQFAELQRLSDTTGTAFRADVYGYASPEGTDAENLALSRTRAERVVAQLVAAGVPAARLSAHGEGVNAASPPDRQRRATFRVQVGDGAR